MAGSGWEEVTAREHGVLAAIERRLNNAEIAAEMFISVRTIESHIASLRRKLGANSRADLIAAAKARRGTSVRVPQNSFVGRDADLAAIRGLLERHRWVTIVGAPGCGKTRLALEVAKEGALVPVVAELQHATEADLAGVLAKEIGLGADSTGDLVAAVAVALSAQPYLLVIDNCDRITEAVEQLLVRLLSLTRTLRVLATSRTPIGGADETIHPLAPLEVSEGAVHLFLERARAAAPTALFTDDDTEVVTGICRRLDGLPLAIELAAARARHLPLAELAERLADGFQTLDRAGPSSRHRTLEAAFDWTWDLLDADEQAMLPRLAALPRTFDLALAERITEPGTSGVVLRLLDRSLVAPVPSAYGGPSRFRLLEPLRALALDRTTPDVVEEVRRTHAEHHAALAAALAATARTDDSPETVASAKRYCPDFNAAVDWALEHDPATALVLVRSLSIGSEQFGADIDSLDAIARAARDPRLLALTSVTDLLYLGKALCYSDLAIVADLAELALSRADRDADKLAAHQLAGLADAYLNRFDSAIAHLAVAERFATDAGDPWHLGMVQHAQGIAHRHNQQGDPATTMEAFEAAIRNFALAGDSMHVNNARYMMASTAAESGYLVDRAVGWVEECVAYARKTGNVHEYAHAILTRARLDPGPDVRGDVVNAVDAFRAVGDMRCLTRGLLLLADVGASTERVPFLHQALDVATRAHDATNQATALERLIHTHWSSGAHRAAVVELGALTSLIGYDAATARCPDGLVDELDQWVTAIAEGRARWPQSGPTAARGPREPA